MNSVSNPRDSWGAMTATAAARAAESAIGADKLGPKGVHWHACTIPAIMHIHILGICGTFMGGIAAIAKAAGHRVTGCDLNVYPPMSTQLESQGIELVPGYGADQIALKPEMWIVGNVVTRGNALMEAILDRGDRYVSGPQWLAGKTVPGRQGAARSGEHRKTATSSLLALVPQEAELAPGFLLGGV